jgi:hypothetical protein
MQTPVRFYITQSDDHAVVRSVPVAVRPELANTDSQTTVTTAPDVDTVPAQHAGPRRARVGQLVRAATRRTDLQR